jgi:hypothetical protein
MKLRKTRCVGNAASTRKIKKLCLVLVANLKGKVRAWCEWALFLLGEKSGPYRAFLALLRCAETAFDFWMAKSETKGEKFTTMLSAGWWDRPRGKAKHDFFWDMIFGPHNFTVWRYRIHWAARSPDFTASESSLRLDLEIEVCGTRPDLPKNWKSALQWEME